MFDYKVMIIIGEGTRVRMETLDSNKTVHG
jgi:hypothetical protein